MSAMEFSRARRKASIGPQTGVGGSSRRAGRIAVKVINHLGDEVIKVFPVK